MWCTVVVHTTCCSTQHLAPLGMGLSHAASWLLSGLRGAAPAAGCRCGPDNRAGACSEVNSSTVVAPPCRLLVSAHKAIPILLEEVAAAAGGGGCCCWRSQLGLSPTQPSRPPAQFGCAAF